MEKIKDDIEEIKVESQLKGILLNILFYVIIFVPMALFNGWCMQLIWGWWITPLTGITLTIIQALGIVLTYNFLAANWNSVHKRKDDNDYGFWQRQLIVLLGKLMLVGLNYILYSVLC